MKTIKYILVAVILTFVRTNQANVVNTVTDVNAETLKRDVLIDIKEYVVEEHAYINLRMLNESKEGVYTLVKSDENGKAELVDSKEIAVNTINKPVLYSFKEAELENKDCEYTLYRISRSVEVVQSWCYCVEQKEFFKNEAMM